MEAKFQFATGKKTPLLSGDYGLFCIMKKVGQPETNPGETISPLIHTREGDLSAPGENTGTLKQVTPQKGKKSSEKAVTERLQKPSRDKREITIGPTTKTGPDITIG